VSAQWLARRDGEWRAKTSDGYYAVNREFEAFHIEALWAAPVKIGAAKSLADAQAICDQHRISTSQP
jgi:hypothetical protein